MTIKDNFGIFNNYIASMIYYVHLTYLTYSERIRPCQIIKIITLIIIFSWTFCTYFLHTLL